MCGLWGHLLTLQCCIWGMFFMYFSLPVTLMFLSTWLLTCWPHKNEVSTWFCALKSPLQLELGLITIRLCWIISSMGSSTMRSWLVSTIDSHTVVFVQLLTHLQGESTFVDYILLGPINSNRLKPPQACGCTISVGSDLSSALAHGNTSS